MSPDRSPTLITISLSTIIKTVLVLGLLWLVFLLKNLVLVLLTSVVIAAAVEPMVRWFSQYRIPRVLAVLIIYVLTFGVVVVLLPFFLFPIIGDLVELSATLPERLGGIPEWISAQGGSSLLSSGFDSLALNDFLVSLQGSFSNLPKGFVQATSLAFGGFFSFVLIVVISFYLAVQRHGIEIFLRLVTPIKQESYILDLWSRAQRKIGYWMQGQLVLGLVIGVLVFLGLTILQVRYALVLGILAAILELIPFFGPILSAVPAVLLGFSVGPSKGLMVLGFYIIIQQFENHLIYPLVVNKIVGLPPLVVILALLVGAQLAGFLGLILAVPLATVLMELTNDFAKNKYSFRALDGQ